jgi:hypothetical protein
MVRCPLSLAGAPSRAQFLVADLPATNIWRRITALDLQLDPASPGRQFHKARTRQRTNASGRSGSTATSG